MANPAKEDDKAKIERMNDFSKIPTTVKNEIKKPTINRTAPTIISICSACILFIEPTLYVVIFTNLNYRRLLNIA